MRALGGLIVRRRKLVWFCLFASIVAVCLGLWVRDNIEPGPGGLRSPIACAVTFQGYSNSLSGQKWAVLIVTNRDFGDLLFMNPITVEFAAHPGDGQDTHWKIPEFIPPRSCARIAVEIPPEPGNWRVRCIVARWTWRDSLRHARVLNRFPDALLPRGTYQLDGLVTGWVPQ